MEIQLPQIIFQIINFSVVVGALSFFLYKPVQKILDERANRIAEGQKAAEKAIADQAAMEDLKKTLKKDADKQAAAILEQANAEAKKQAQELLKQAQEHAQAELLKVQNEWNAEKKELVKDLKQQFADAVVSATEKVVGTSIDSKAHAKLIDQELTQLLQNI